MSNSPPAPLHPDRDIAARAFDAAFYANRYPDVIEGGVDPLHHYLVFGWREGRDPSAEFSTKLYLEMVPELAASGVNPLVHWLTNGRPRLRRPTSPEGFRYDVIARVASVDARVAAIGAEPQDLETEADIVAALSASRGALAGLHLTFSHDDYTATLGGLQLSIRREADRLAVLGRDHLHVYPARPWPVVRPGGVDGALGLVWNGARLGHVSARTLVSALRKVAIGDAAGRTLAIHSLLGHDADEVAEIAEAAGLSGGVFWLHDFASLCAGFHLLRNDVEDCGAPPADSAACGVCVYGPWRGRHEAAHARLFERLNLTVAAPSQVTMDLWRDRARYPHAGTVVLPHATLIPRAQDAASAGGTPFRLAYAGLPVPHKGFPIFADLAARFEDDPRYAFLHLGARPEPGVPTDFVEVRGDMSAALETARADAVLIWPLCRETFSFVAYEAVAAGCAVITGPDSGNVRAFVEEGARGQVLDEAALVAAFETGDILELARAQRRPMLYDLRFSDLSFDLPAP